MVIVGSPRGDLGELQGQSKVISEKILNDFPNIFLNLLGRARIPPGVIWDRFLIFGDPGDVTWGRRAEGGFGRSHRCDVQPLLKKVSLIWKLIKRSSDGSLTLMFQCASFYGTKEFL